jgi:Tol biopolymer transport system component
MEILPPGATDPAPSAETATSGAAEPTHPAVTAIPAGQAELQGEVAIIQRIEGKDRLFLLNLGTGERRALPEVPNVDVTFSQSPQWSPDGSRLAWMSRYAGRPHIAAMDLAEGEPYQLPAAEAFSSVSSPAWLEDGKRVSFWASSGSQSLLVIADGVTGEELERIELPEYRNLFVWNPRNGLVAYARQNFDRYEVVISGSASTADSPLESGGEEYAPVWSNDGEWLAFQSDAGRSAGENEIWIVRIDGTQLRQVTGSPGGTWSRAPTWSPDGRWIAYVSNQAGSIGADFGELFAVEVSTGRVVQLTSSGGSVYDWRPAWRPR